MKNKLSSQISNKALKIAIKTVKKVGDLIKNEFYMDKKVKRKGRNNFVSNLDLISEEMIVNELKHEYPDWNILAEETDYPEQKDGFTWIIDPLDGTTNSIYGIPFIAINIALVNNDTVNLGITYDPLRDELFYAIKGNGAFLNNKPIHISKVGNISDALVGFDLGYISNKAKDAIKVMNYLWGKAISFRILGSAALGLAYVACGRINLYFHKSVYPWDIASGILLVNEAGGKTISWDNKVSSYISSNIIASNSRLSKQFLELLKTV